MRKCAKRTTIRGFADDIAVIFACNISILLLGFNAISSAHNAPSKDLIAYNNGVCSECGGTLQFYQGVVVVFDKTYIYKCEDCGYAVELHSMQ